MLNWILDRCDGKVDAVETAIGYLPKAEDLDVSGLDLSDEVMAELLSVDKEAWLDDVENQKEFFAPLGDRMPAELIEEQKNLEKRLSK